MVVLLMLGTGGVVGRSPVYNWHAPYAGHGGSSEANRSSVNCSKDTTTFTKPAYFDLHTGHFGVNQTARSDPGSTCPFGDLSDDFTVYYYFNFNSSVGGYHVLRSVWWLNWEANLTTFQFNTSAVSNDAQAQVTIIVSEDLVDLTTQGIMGQTSYSVSDYVMGNNSTLIGGNGRLSLPLPNPVVLTKGHQYEVDLQAYFEAYVEASGPRSWASADLSVGTSGHATILKGIAFH